MTKEAILALIRNKAEKYGIPADIVYGVCMQESQLNPLAYQINRHIKPMKNTANAIKANGPVTKLYMMGLLGTWKWFQHHRLRPNLGVGAKGLTKNLIVAAAV